MDTDSKNTLDDDRIGRLLWKLSLPAFLGMFVIMLYNVVDTIFIGRYVGALGIAGLSIVFPLQMFSMGISHMTGMGGASLISRLIGTGNISRAERALGNAITLTVVLSVIITVGGLVDVDFWLRLMGSSETVLPYARDYMTIILIGMFFQTFAMMQSFLIRAEGNSHVPMVGMIMGAGLNIVLDAVFIIPLGMGIKGAALATVIAQLISVIYFTIYYYTGKNFLSINLKDLALEMSILKGILSIGIASFAMTLASSLSAVIVNRLLVAYGGDLAVSAYGIINRIMMFAVSPGMSVGQGLQPILGFNYGAKRYDRALKAVKISLAAAVVMGVVAFGFLYFVPEPFLRIFTTDDGLVTLGAYAAKRIWMVLYLVGPMMVGSTVFQAIGKPVQSFVTAVGRPALFLIPAVFILPQFWQIDGVWLAFPITDGLNFILTFALLIPTLRDFRRAASTVGRGQLVEIYN